MRRMISITIILAALASAALAPAAEADFSPKAFFEHIDLARPEMAPVRELLEKNRPDEALALWRDLAIARIRARDFGTYGWHSYKGHDRPITEAKWYCGRATEEELKEWHPKYVGKDGTKVRFKNGNFEYPFPSMVYLFWETDDVHYLNCAYERIVDFCTTIYPEFWRRYRKQLLSGEKMESELFKELPDWRHNVNALHTAWRLKNIMLVTAGFAKSLGPDKAEDWENVLAPCRAEAPRQRLDLIDPVWLARIALSGYEHSASQLLWFCQNSGSVPNQRSTGLKALSMLWKSFPNFKKAPQLGDRIDRAYTEMLENNFLPDGGSMEQSFNYNREDMKGLEEVAQFYEGDDLPFVRKMRERAAARRAINDGLRTPLGSLPQVGNMSHALGMAFWKDPDALKKYFEAGPMINAAEVEPQTYLSKAYRYSGFFAMRDGWDLASRYLFFHNSRFHTGHLTQGVLSIQAMAFARQLVVTGGPPTYGFKRIDDFEYVDVYLSEQSSMKCNTVLVDGMTQANNRRRYTRAPQTPMAGRWHTSERFDLVDGNYDGGYIELAKKVNRAQADMSVEHERVVAFARQAGVWVIVDRMHNKGDKERRFMQVWNFLPYVEDDDIRKSAAGFKQDQFDLDPKARRFATADPEGPNATFHHFGPPAMEYRKYYGDKDKRLGWFARGIGDGIPAVDVHAVWSSSAAAPLLTILAPSDTGKPDPAAQARSLDDPDRGIAGFDATMPDGGRLTVLCAAEPTALRVGDVAAQATLLLVWRQGEEVSGLVRGADEAILPGGKKATASGGCFEFVRKADGSVETTGIAIPENAEKDPDPTLSPDLDMRKFPEDRWTLRHPDRTDTEGLEQGLVWRWSRRPSWSRLYDLTLQALLNPAEQGKSADIDATAQNDRLASGNQGAMVFDGYIQAPRDGIYTFFVECRDGIRVFIRNTDREFELPADAECTYRDHRGVGCAPLQKGLHRLRIAYKKTYDRDRATIEVEGPGIERQPLPAEWLWRQKD